MLYVINATFDTLISSKTVSIKTVSKSPNHVCNSPPARTPARASSTR
jgi:hypothetical protein